MTAQELPHTGREHPAIERLRQAGAEAFDPVRLHYLGALARRLARHDGTVKRLLEARLAQTVAAYENQLAQTQPRTPKPEPAAAQTEAQGMPAPTLADLTRQLAQHHHAPSPERSADAEPLRPELKSVRHHRSTWSRLSTDRQLAVALGQAPKNAGPINSHRLVLDSLTLMRDISPDYLHRFVAYADTLLCLEQHDQAPPKPKLKPKPRRATGRA